MCKYVIIDNSEYIDYFFRHLRDEYAPITLSDHTKAILLNRGVRAIGVLDYLDFSELKEITTEAFGLSNAFLDKLDDANTQNYLTIFGRSDVRLMRATASYLFKRFINASLNLVYGLEAILKKEGEGEISYVHDGRPRIICGTRNENGFFYPDDVTWDILDAWQHKDKPKISRIKAPRHDVRPLIPRGDPKVGCFDFIREARTIMAPLKRAILNERRRASPPMPGKKTILFMSPLYDFEAVLDSAALTEGYNIFVWEPKKNPARSSFDKTAALSFTADGPGCEDLPGKLDILSLAVPLLEEFYAKKLSDIIYYWNEARWISAGYEIAAVCWGNSPHRYPAGMMKEFFRLQGVPIVGMQHGGLTGSNDIGASIFETDFNHCDYYFSYGFTNEDVQALAAAEAPTVIPVGSIRLKDISDRYPLSANKRKKIDILYPVSLPVGEFYYENEFSTPRLFEFQKKVIDTLADIAADKTVVIKFPIGKYLKSPLGIYMANKYPNKFTIVDHVSFADCLYMFEPGLIVIEDQSTPLYEALTTASNIIVYNNPDWAGLTEKALGFLARRSVICRTQDDFLEALKTYAKDGGITTEDVTNKEFFNSYCLGKSDPKESVANAISAIAAREFMPAKELVYGT